MKQELDDDLIITNEIESEPEDSQPVVTPIEDEDAVDSESEGKAPKDDGQVKEADDSQSFREALNKVEEEESEKPQRMTLNKILVGDFFTAQILRRQLGIVLVCAFIIIIYISNRYSCQKQMIEVDKLKKELKDSKYKALSTSSQLTEKSRQSNVLDMLKLCNDSSLHAADQAPFIIQVPEK